MTLRLRLVAIIGLSLTLLWSVVAVWMFMDVREQLRSALDERLAASARMVAGLVARLPAERLQVSGPPVLPLDVIARDGLLQRVRELGGYLERGLRAALGAHPHVGDIRGRGLFWGVELVAERANKRWFDPARKTHARLKTDAMARGILVYPMGGTVDGRCGDHVLLAPPFICSEAEIDFLVARLAESVDAVTASVA